jgi:hypothetical protein
MTSSNDARTAGGNGWPHKIFAPPSALVACLPSRARYPFLPGLDPLKVNATIKDEGVRLELETRDGADVQKVTFSPGNPADPATSKG